jgi:hypothetical protein
VLAFAFFENETEAQYFQPTIVYADKQNKLIEAK